MSFAKWVSEETVMRANFNYWEPSYMFTKNDLLYTAYLSQVGMIIPTNIVVIEYVRRSKDGYRRTDWFFSTFTGKSSAQCETREEEQTFYDKIDGTVARKNRVPGRRLEKRILEIVEMVSKEDLLN